MSRLPEPRATLDPVDDDPLDEVVANCLDSGSAELESAVLRACEAHPGSAAEIRRRIEVLRSAGLLRPTGFGEDERFPEQLGDFRLLERLGGGGMGVVFRARQESLGREVAIKLIRPEHLYFPHARTRFRRETEAAARLHHPGVVPIHTVGEEKGIPFFAMELVSGSTLADALGELRAQLPEKLRGSDLAHALQRCAPAWAQWDDSTVAPAFGGTFVDSILRVVVQLADALQHAHARGVLHRDVKPSNVAVTAEGRALLFDFGLASLSDASRITLSRVEIGSLSYMAPEQLRTPRGAIDRRSDIYSLGVTLYELLALQLPFAERELLDTRRAILEGTPRSLRSLNRAVSRDLETVCAKAMERDAARRYDNAAALARDLRNVLEQRPIDARPASTALHVRRWIQRHPIATTALAAMFALPTALSWQKSVHAGELGAALDDAERAREAAQIEAKEAHAINDFLITLFSAVDPSIAQGREVTARDLLEEAARRLESDILDQPLVRARLLNTIGESYTSLGEWERAEEILKRAFDLNQAHAGAESLAMVQSLQALASLEQQLGRPAALEHARSAAELHRKLAPAPTFELANSLLTYALALAEAGQLDEAERVYQETLGVIERMSGDRRDLRVGVLANLANLHLKRQDLELALTTARETLELQRSLGPAPHPAIGSALNAMALALTGLRRFDEALAVYDELLDEERRLTGEESTRFATFLVSQSNVVIETGQSAEAILLLEHASELFARIAPPEHDVALQCRERLGAAYRRAARWQEALDTFEALVPVIDSVSGPAGGRALSLQLDLARCREALGRWSALQSGLSSALERAREAGIAADDGSESQANALLARELARHGDVEGARSLLARSLELRGHAGIETSTGAWTRLTDGLVAESAGDLDRARATLEALAALDRGPRNAEATPAIARAHLAAVLASSAPERSRHLATRARAELESELGRDHPETRAAADFLESLR